MSKVIKCCVSNQEFASNRLETDSSWFAAIVRTFWKYFFVDNFYFTVIATLQVSTHPRIGWLDKDWSPTGCFSTLVPLVLCFLLDLSKTVIGKYKVDRGVTEWNNRRRMSISENKIKRNVEFYPGDTTILKPGEVAEMDLIAVSVVGDDDAPVRISHANINGESRVMNVKTIPFPKEGDTLRIIENDPKHLHSFRGEIASRVIDSTSLIVNGSKLCSCSSVMCLVVACGQDRKMSPSSHTFRLKPNSLDQFISRDVMSTSLYLLMGMVFSLSVKSGELFTVVRSWIVLNGVFPFSIKILLSLLRSLQTRWFLSERVTSISSNVVDEIHQADWIVFDKTGTLTQNKMQLVAVTDDNGTVFGHTPDKLRVALPYVVCRNALGTPETEEDQIIADVCANMGLVTRMSLVPTTNLHYHTHRPISSQLFSTGVGTSRIVSKGSVTRILSHLSIYERTRLERAESEMLRVDPSLRLMAIAVREFPCDPTCTDYTRYEADMQFVGLIAFRDNLVVGVESVMEDLKLRRKSVAILTGDRHATAVAVANKLRLTSSSQKVILIGPETDVESLRSDNKHSTIIGYGLTPAGKKQVVDWLQDVQGKRCIAIGDGINDVDMIESARVGIALSNCIPSCDVRCSSVLELPRLLDTSRSVHGRNQTVTQFTMWKCFCVSVALFWMLWTGRTMYLFDLVTHQGFHMGWSAIHPVLIGLTGSGFGLYNPIPPTEYIAFSSVVVVVTGLTLFSMLSMFNMFFLAFLIGLVNAPLCWIDRRRPVRVMIAQFLSAVVLYVYSLTR